MVFPTRSDASIPPSHRHPRLLKVVTPCRMHPVQFAAMGRTTVGQPDDRECPSDTGARLAKSLGRASAPARQVVRCQRHSLSCEQSPTKPTAQPTVCCESDGSATQGGGRDTAGMPPPAVDHVHVSGYINEARGGGGGISVAVVALVALVAVAMVDATATSIGQEVPPCHPAAGGRRTLRRCVFAKVPSVSHFLGTHLCRGIRRCASSQTNYCWPRLLFHISVSFAVRRHHDQARFQISHYQDPGDSLVGPHRGAD